MWKVLMAAETGLVTSVTFLGFREDSFVELKT
jgi:hypothetical protein